MVQVCRSGWRSDGGGGTDLRPRRDALSAWRLSFCSWTRTLSAIALLLSSTAVYIAARGKPSSRKESALERVLRTGVLRVGCPCDYAPFASPFELEAKDRPACWKVRGHDIEAIHSLADSLSAAVSTVNAPWARLVERIDSFDIGLGGISLTLQRQQHAFFTIPYFSDAKVLLALCQSIVLAAFEDEGTQGLRKLKGSLKIAVNEGGTNERTAQQLGVPVEHLARNGEQFEKVLRGEANATITDGAEAEIVVQSWPQLCMSRRQLTPESGKAYLISRGDVVWQQYVNLWLESWIRSGDANASFRSWTEAFALQTRRQGFTLHTHACAD